MSSTPEFADGDVLSASGALRHAPPHRLDVCLERGRVWVRPSGELDLAVARLIDETLRELQGGGCNRLVLDARRASSIDGAALRVLFEANARVRRTGGRLEVRCGGGQLVMRLLALTGAEDQITISERTGMAPETTIGTHQPVAA